MKDIQRVLQYHGAETIHTYELDLPNVENVRKQSRLHARCGTNLLIVMVVSILYFAFRLGSLVRTYS